MHHLAQCSIVSQYENELLILVDSLYLNLTHQSSIKSHTISGNYKNNIESNKSNLIKNTCICHHFYHNRKYKVLTILLFYMVYIQLAYSAAMKLSKLVLQVGIVQHLIITMNEGNHFFRIFFSIYMSMLVLSNQTGAFPMIIHETENPSPHIHVASVSQRLKNI